MTSAQTTSRLLFISVAGWFPGGYLAERVSKGHIMLPGDTMPVVATLWLSGMERMAMLYSVMFFLGMDIRAAVVYPLLITETLGLLSFSKRVGVMEIPFMIGAAIGQVSAAKLCDGTGTYAGVSSSF